MSEKLQILVVEDNPADIDFIHEMLPQAGPLNFQIESVERLSEALTRLERKDIDLVLLDLGLPDSHGLTTFHKLRQAAPDIPLIVLTGTDDHELAVAAVRDGAQDYLVKGQVSGRALIRMIRYALERQKAAEALRASEVRYRRLFETARDGILILDAKTGMVVDVNSFLIELLGYSRETFLEKKVWELGFFRDIVANQFNFAELQQKEYLHYEDKPLETSDGRRIEVEFVSNVYQVNHQKVIQCNIRDITARKQTEAERDKLIQDLQEALANVKSLSGLLPICSSCKKIRDDKGYWSQVESYIQKHSEAEFSHSICPDCFKKLYPNLKVGGSGDSPEKAP